MKNRKIYDQIADTFLGARKKIDVKRDTRKQKKIIVLAVIIISILFTALFLKKSALSNGRDAKDVKGAVYVLSERYPLRLSYNLQYPSSGIKNFSFSLPPVDLGAYKLFALRIKGDKEADFTKIIKIEFENSRHEKDSFYADGITEKWQEFSAAFDKLNNISDWSEIT